MDTARGTNKRNLSKQKKPSEKYLLASDRNALKKKKWAECGVVEVWGKGDKIIHTLLCGGCLSLLPEILVQIEDTKSVKSII